MIYIFHRSSNKEIKYLYKLYIPNTKKLEQYKFQFGKFYNNINVNFSLFHINHINLVITYYVNLRTKKLLDLHKKILVSTLKRNIDNIFHSFK